MPEEPDGSKFFDCVFQELMKPQEKQEISQSSEAEFLNSMESFRLTEQQVANVVSTKIYSMNWHPGTAKLFLAVGDAIGKIGIGLFIKLVEYFGCFNSKIIFRSCLFLNIIN